jgi:hypothetical protein
VMTMRCRSPRQGPPAPGLGGFSLVETLVSVALLGVGIVALLRLHDASISGTTISRARAAATGIALDRIERLGTAPAVTLPECEGPVGCRASTSEPRSALQAAGDFACTRYVDDMGQLDGPAPASGRFRVDTVVAAHPGAGQQHGGMMVTVSVCWRDEAGALQEVRAQRLMLPEV